MAGQTRAQEPPQQLIREVVYNEGIDHQTHAYWRYWVEQNVASGTRVLEKVETADGPITRVILSNGRPLDEPDRRAEQARLDRLQNSSVQQTLQHQEYAEDEKKVALIMEMLPDAFLFDDEGEQGGFRHLRYRPNPSYAAHTVEAKVFRALSGDLWIDTRMKRMARIEGHLNDNVDFGFGVLGRVNRGSWFRMVRKQVSPTEWKTCQLEVHMTGRAIVFKTIAHETSEVHVGFAAVPPGLSIAQGVRVLEQASTNNAMAMTAQFKTVSLGQHNSPR